ncbi:MAGUK p55 subfamily member 2 [Clonorchis sinensis]|uniref:MAGUK p55 subfamily member 2 n=1 Tax=Clonorchis sinensis TaxID=79923 RepID=G7YIH1_CLOSI|nr:MAGUK p55 subfamily member 2 [Clonorchis sinensis]
MPDLGMKKPRNIYALQICSRTFENPEQLAECFATSGSEPLTEAEVKYLQSFLSQKQLRNTLQLLDDLTTGINFQALVTSARPRTQEECDSLQALSELWTELEGFVMQTREQDEPEAHELYDLLADMHIRELLVAYDDVANRRYLTEVFDLTPVYTEPENPRSTKVASSSKRNPPVPQSEEMPDDSLVEVTAISEDAAPLSTGPPPNSRNKNSNSYDLVEQPSHSKKGGSVSKLVDHFEKSRDPDMTKSQTPTNPPPSKPRTPPVGDESWGSVTSLTAAHRPKTNKPLTVNEAVPRQQRGPELKFTPPSASSASPSKPSLSPLSPSPQATRRTRVPGGSPASRRIPVNSESPPTGDESRLSKPSKTTLPRSPDSFHSTSLPDRSKRHSAVHKGSAPESKGTLSLTRRLSNRSSRRNHTASIVDNTPPQPGQTRKVQLRRDRPGESIGITVAVRTPSPPPSPTTQFRTAKSADGKPLLAIQRVLAGSLADRNGSIFPGDILLEFNGYPVHSLDEIYTLMQQTSSALECELLVQTPESNGSLLRPGLQHKQNSTGTKRYIRTFFDYDSTKDSLLPTGDVGLSFKAGDVLELVDDQDPNWWQVRPLNDSHGQVRLVPSQTLEERRTAFNQEKIPGGTLKKTRRTIKMFFRAADSSGLRLRSDIWSYEEVVPWPQSMVPCLLLLGVTGVGRRNLKVLLASSEPKRFAYPLSDTTDPTASTSQFHILPKAQMEADVRSGAYVEWGKVGGNYYGIRFSAIRKIIASGRTAVLDCQPQTVHLLHQPEFNPCTIFIAAPTFEVAKRMMKDGLENGVTKNNRSDEELRCLIEESQTFARAHRHLYFHSLTNSDMRESVARLSRLISRLERHPSWIPSGWAYELSVPGGPAPNFVPGSSSLSALGIPNLPPAHSSTIARSVLSGISEASSESANRLARPPSICSESVLSERQLSGLRSSLNRPAAAASPITPRQRLYERRRKPQHDFQPMSPAIPEQDTPSESGVSHSVVGNRVIETRHHPKRLHSEQPSAPKRFGGRESVPSIEQSSAREALEHTAYENRHSATVESSFPRDFHDNTRRNPRIAQQSTTRTGLARQSQAPKTAANPPDDEDDFSETSSEDDQDNAV